MHITCVYNFLLKVSVSLSSGLPTIYDIQMEIIEALWSTIDHNEYFCASMQLELKVQVDGFLIHIILLLELKLCPVEFFFFIYNIDIYPTSYAITIDPSGQ